MFPAIAIAWAVLGCGGASAPEVLQLTDLEPRSIEAGDRIVITGQNFPSASDIRRIRVTFRGGLSRPGTSRCTAPVEVTVSDPPPDSFTTDALSGQTRESTYAESNQRTIRLEGPDRLELQASDWLLQQLSRCSSERNAPDVPHATISLSGLGPRSAPYGVTVAIDGLTGRLAVRGTLRGPTLDVRRATARHYAEDLEARRAAERVLDFMGIELANGQPGEGGLRVASVRVGGPADHAGIAGNDLLVRVDGVSVLSLSDFRPARDTALAVVTTLRGDVLDEHPVSLAGMVSRTPKDLVGGAVVLLVLLGLAVLALVRGRGMIAWMLAGHRARQRRVHRQTGFIRWLAASIARALGARAAASRVLDRRDRLSRLAPSLAVACIATTVAAAPFSPYVIGLRADVLFAWLGVSIVTFAAALLALRGRTAGGPGLVATSARVWSFQIVAALAMIGAVVAAGSLDTRTLVSAQAGGPWRWLAFRSPALLLLAGLYFAAPIAIHAWVSPNATRERDDLRAVDSFDAHPVMRAIDSIGPLGVLGAEWIAITLQSLLGSLLFLGGWSLPGITTAHQDASASLQMLGGSAWIAKSWAVAFVWLHVRRGLAAPGGPDRRTSLCWRYALPASLLGLSLVVALYRLESRLPWTVSFATTVATFALATVCVVFAALRRAPALLRST